MMLKFNRFWTPLLFAALIAGLVAQTPSAQSAAPAGRPQGGSAPSRPPQPQPGTTGAPQVPIFRVQVDAVSMDVVVKDEQGRFIPDLRQEDFEIYEDGVKQDI